MTYQPRYYQREAKRAGFKGWADYRTELIHLATGGGKTPIAAWMIDALVKKGKRCLYLADANELCQQPIDVIYRMTGNICALEKAADRASLDAQIVVASSQTLFRKDRLERYPRNHFDAILTDEAHRGADRDKVIHDYFETAHICGFTATPHKKGLRDLQGYYEHVCYRKPMFNMVEEAFAPRYIGLKVPIEIDLSEVTRTVAGEDGRDYNAGELETTIAPHYGEVIDALIEHAKGEPTIVFLPLVRASQSFAELCRQRGIAARHVDGASPDRTELIEAFSRGRFQVLTNSDLLSTGVDIPTATVLVNLSPTRSIIRLLQRVGRIMRPLPGLIDDLPEQHQAQERRARMDASAKPAGIFLDFLFQDDDFGIMRAEHVMASSPEDARLMYERTKNSKSPEDLEAIAKLVLAEKEEALVKSLERAAAKAGKGVTYDQIAIGLHDLELLEWEPTARWHNSPVSKKQEDLLARMGISPTGMTKGQASRIIDIAFERREHGLCTFKQMAFLRKQKIDNADKLSFATASKLIDGIYASFGRRKATA